MKKFKDFKIRTKIDILFIILGACMMLFAYVSISSLSTMNKLHEAVYDEYGASAADFGIAAYHFQAMVLDMEQMLLANDTDTLNYYKEEYNQSKGILLDYSGRYMAMIQDEELVAKSKEVNGTLTAYIGEMEVAIDSILKGDRAAAIQRLSSPELAQQLKDVNQRIEQLYSTLQERGNGESSHITSRGVKTIVACSIANVIMIIINMLMAIYVVKLIQRPVHKLTAAADRLAEGAVDVEIRRESKDEFGDLAESFGKMVDNMKVQAEAVQKAAEGDRTMEIAPRSEQDVVGNALKRMMQEENKVLSGIKEASYQVTTGSEQVASASQSLAQGSTEQASAIEQITASIGEITERTKVNANDANETNRLVGEAKEHAVLGNERMEQMRGAMAEINDSSENISKIIKVIDDIAFQTNILALNAAVEAARAGQHGRGFAVVADEVRNLAGKSAQAASETAELIEDSIRKVAHGSALAEETATALAEIVASIDKVVGLVNSIAIASNDQATAITQIDQAIIQVSQVVQTNSATSEQCAAASEELSAQAARLRDMIARYQLKGVDYSTMEEHTQGAGNVPYLTASSQNVISLEDGFGKY